MKSIELDGEKIVLQIWDTAGQERFKTITRQYYRGAMGVILVFDVTSKESFEHIEYWLSNISEFASQSVCRILIANKCDLAENRQVSTEQASALAQRSGIAYMEVSAKNNYNVQEAFTQIARNILPNIDNFLAAQKSASTKSVDLHKRKRRHTQCTRVC